MGDIQGTAKVEIQPREKKPAFVADLQNAQVVEGFPVRYDVKIIGYPPPTLKWLHNGEEILPGSEHAKIINNPDGTASLIIDKALADDAGAYQVVATNDTGAVASNAILSVAPRADTTAPEKAPKFVSALRDGNTDEGQELTLSAPFIANPVPEIIWTKDGEPVKPSERVLMTCDGKHVGLTINPAEVTDSGVYSCLLANPLGEDESKCKANVRKVFQAPHFSLRLCDQPALLGLDHKLPVRVAGVPYPELQWTYNGRPLANCQKYAIKHDGDNSVLIIRNCNLDDIGEYKCVAKNREGEDSTKAKLDVVDKM